MRVASHIEAPRADRPNADRANLFLNRALTQRDALTLVRSLRPASCGHACIRPLPRPSRWRSPGARSAYVRSPAAMAGFFCARDESFCLCWYRRAWGELFTGSCWEPLSREPASPRFSPECLVRSIMAQSSATIDRDELWARYFTGAPARQRRCVERYSIVKERHKGAGGRVTTGSTRRRSPSGSAENGSCR